MDPKILDDMARKLAAALPPGIHEFQQDIEKNLRAALEAMLSKMNLVSREEYEVQQAVLERTRIKLEHLQKQMEELEKQILKP